MLASVMWFGCAVTYKDRFENELDLIERVSCDSWNHVHDLLSNSKSMEAIVL